MTDKVKMAVFLNKTLTKNGGQFQIGAKKFKIS
jgi:hypothetical protein